MLIIEIFNKAILQVKYPKEEMRGFDGTNYYFSVNYRTGTIWSPKSGSKMDRLVKIGNHLINFISNSEENFNKEFKDRIEQLSIDLNNGS